MANIDAMKFLESVGVPNIAQATHLEESTIRALLERDFDALRGKNVKGFIKILEREYDVDLQTLLDEYNIYVDTQLPASKTVSTGPVIQKSSGFSHSQAQENKSYWYIWLAVLAVLLWAIFYFKLHQIFDFVPNLFGDKNESVEYSNSDTVVRAEEQLASGGVVVPQFDENKTLINGEELANSEINASMLFDNNETEGNLSITVRESNATDDNESAEIPNTAEAELFIGDVVIVPKKQLWIGFIDVASGKKNTSTTAKPLVIDTKKEQLILTGHGDFSVEVKRNGKSETLKSKGEQARRYHVKDGGISEISYDDFVKLNGGKAW